MPFNKTLLSLFCLKFIYEVSSTRKLFKRLRDKYSKEQLVLLNNLQKCYLKLNGNLLKIKFLNSCIQARVCPNVIFHRIKRSKLKQSPSVEKMFLKDEIGRLVSVNRYLKVNYIKFFKNIDSFLSTLDRLKLLKFFRQLNNRINNRIVDKNNKSLVHLKIKRYGRFSITKTVVSNFSDYTPNENERFVLENGLSFSIPFENVQRENIFSEFEILSGQLKHHKPLSQLKLDSCNAKLYSLSHSFTNIKCSSSDFRMFKDCNLAYKSLKSNKDIVILKADKGSSFVLLNLKDYLVKMNAVLDDKEKFIKLGPTDDFDSTVKIERAFQNKLRNWHTKGYISQDVYEFVRPVGSQCPKLYGLPKTHKTGIPTRPILDMKNSAQFNISKFLIKILEPVSEKFSTFCIKDSFSFVDVIRNNIVTPDKMCSFDIKSLFTNVPVDETINICLNELYNSDLIPPKIPKDVCLSLLNMAVKNVEFSFNSYIYRQIDGVAMGSAPLALY